MKDASRNVILFIIGIFCLGIIAKVGIEYYNENTESAIKLKELREKSFSNLDSELNKSDSVYNEVAKEIFGEWEESKSGIYSKYLFYKIGNNIFVSIKADDDSEKVEELTEKQNIDGIEYHFKNGGYAGEYFLINKNNDLLFLNRSGVVFTKGIKI
jgi:hypothetical protein